MIRCHRLIVFISLAFALLSSNQAYAAAPAFENLSPTDVDNIVREFSGAATLHSGTAPSSYGSIFGFEIGVVGGATTTPKINELTKQNIDAEFPLAPHGGLLGAVTLPLGITGELVALPKIETKGVKYQQYAAALKWTMTDTVLSFLPLNLSLRGFISKNELEYNQVIQNASTFGLPVDTTVTYEGTVTGLHLMASPKLIPIFEPYAGLGVLSGKGKIQVTGANATFFNFTTSQTAESSPTSLHVFAGLDVRFLVLGFGLEYSRAFETDNYTAKLSAKF